MKKLVLISLAVIFALGCKSQKVVTNRSGQKVAQITWEQETINVGDVKLGEKKEVEFKFENTGSAILEIELVTACKCTTLDWPRKPIAPGEKGVISVTYDSTDQTLGELTKTVDVIANTYPIVVEAFFTVNVIK